MSPLDDSTGWEWLRTAWGSVGSQPHVGAATQQETPTSTPQEQKDYTTRLVGGDFAGAAAIAERVRARAIKRGDLQTRILCEGGLIYIAGCQGALAEAEARLRAILPLFRSLRDIDGEAEATARLGVYYRSADDPARRAEGEALLARAYVLFRQGTRYSAAVADDEMGKQLQTVRVDWPVDNIREYYQALIAGRIDPRNVLAALSAPGDELNYGAKLRVNGYPSIALQVHTLSLRLWLPLRETPPHAWSAEQVAARIALIRNELGRDYVALGRWNDAITCFCAARDELLALRDLRAEDSAEEEIGQVSLEKGDFVAARESFLRMKELRVQLASHADPSVRRSCHRTRDVSWGDYWLGVTARRTGDLVNADRLLAKAHAGFMITGPHRGNALCAWEIARIYRDRGLLKEARQWYEAARYQLAQTHFSLDWIAVEQELGQVCEQLGDLAAAASVYEDALRHAEWLTRRDGNSVGSASEYNARLQPLFADAARFRAENPAPGIFARDAALEALVVAEAGRSVYLRKLASDTGRGIGWEKSRMSPEDTALWELVEGERARAGRAVYHALTSPGADSSGAEASVAAAMADVRDADTRSLLLREYLLYRYLAHRRNEMLASPSARDLVTLARRNPETLYLSWTMLDESRTLMFALSADAGAFALKLPVGEAHLRELILAWRTALQQETIIAAQDEQKLSRTLYDLLLSRVETLGLLREGRYRRLLVVGDGPLRDLPFAALCDGRGRRLIERWAISAALSLGTLHWPVASGRATNSPLLCIADPLGSEPTGDPNGIEKRVQITSVNGRALPLAPLRNARLEAERLRELIPGARVLVGGRAHEATLLREPGMKDYMVLHFATHGILDPENGLRSWLLLARPTPGAIPADGRLEAREIAEMSLGARLAVLSACDTGRVQARGGDGLIGFAWAFRAAGCPSVVASLWGVDDAATAQLIGKFYERLRAGARKDDALRDAMLTVRAVPRTRRPAYWAAFQVIGDATPLRELAR